MGEDPERAANFNKNVSKRDRSRRFLQFCDGTITGSTAVCNLPPPTMEPTPLPTVEPTTPAPSELPSATTENEDSSNSTNATVDGLQTASGCVRSLMNVILLGVCTTVVTM